MPLAHQGSADGPGNWGSRTAPALGQASEPPGLFVCLDSSQALHYDGSISNRAKGRHPMRVTPEMTTESGGRLDKLADVLDVDGRGAKAAFSERGDQVKLTAASTEWPAVSLYFDADTAEALGVLLIQRAGELRARS